MPAGDVILVRGGGGHWLLSRTVWAIWRSHRFGVAQTQVFFEKLIGFEYAAKFRLRSAVAIVCVGVKEFGFLAEGRRDVGEGTAEFHAHDSVGVHGIVDAPGALGKVSSSPTCGLHPVGEANFPSSPPGPFPDFAVQIVPAIFDELEPGLQSHGTGHIADLLQLYF